MKSPVLIVLALVLCLNSATASVFLPHDANPRVAGRSSPMRLSNSQALSSRRSLPKKSLAAMAIPGYGVAEQVFVGGFGNFLTAFNLIITARILLTWIPQAAGVQALQPLYAITDPYLNIFRGIIPSIGGFDLSPLAAFFFLNVLTNATAAVGCEIPPELQKKMNKRKKFPFSRRRQQVIPGM
eukprot:CAMPEP_0119005028 /NCGR_PEP_ID=MMETSP1176-20130426/1488_1 /TAXON_ID=265551 /ORGANISM="Synedropsis recta cf, Strain CCMP1620" /LENGTH=182 /DNA_ID=CAMNT_0006956793 /DNA_START=75 /DNA_END=623 /DNA_ORIENTATION=+